MEESHRLRCILTVIDVPSGNKASTQRRIATKANAAYAFPVTIARDAPPVVGLEGVVLVTTAAGLGVVVADVTGDSLVLSSSEVSSAAEESLALVAVVTRVVCVVEGLSVPAVFTYPHSKLHPSREFG